MTDCFEKDDLIRIAKRENNKRRGYLYVNPLQGKHIPVSPSLSIRLFDLLAKKLEEAYPEEKILLIGFAETATAIGAELACRAKNAAYYMNTTREEIAGADYLFFTESHSHAREQRLVINGLENILDQVDRIVFAEDEVTTGNTIEKIIRLLQKKYREKDVKFGILSILNSMPEERLMEMESKGFSCGYLYHIPPQYRIDEIECYSDREEGEKENSKASPFIRKERKEDSKESLPPGRKEETEALRRIQKGKYWNSRLVLSVKEARERVECFTDSVLVDLPELEEAESLLILGTEEFMFPGLLLGKKAEELWPDKKIRFHATTRSPIEVYPEEAYPLHSRAELESLYEEGRKSFLYNLRRYDQVLILTDAKEIWEKGLQSLTRALKECGNEKITLIQWGEFVDAE